jgi:Fe-S cluster assembly ATP-binding protein
MNNNKNIAQNKSFLSNNKPLLLIKDLSITPNHDGSKAPHPPSNNELISTSTAPLILENLNLTMYPGEIHAIMGPNGAGKSTLANVLARNAEYKIVQGSITYLGEDLTQFSPEECARKGIFLSFQNPTTIPGVSNIQFLRNALNAIRSSNTVKPVDTINFVKLAKEKMKLLQIPEEFLYRSVNEDFSGGEKKRNEILQLILLEPKLAILDEIDSGLDIDGLNTIATALKEVKKNTAILLITHYNRILDYLEPDFVHILTNKKISLSGNIELGKKLESTGYALINQQ